MLALQELPLHPNHIADKDPGARGIAATTLLATADNKTGFFSKNAGFFSKLFSLF
jgi:hypothetical protein